MLNVAGKMKLEAPPKVDVPETLRLPPMTAFPVAVREEVTRPPESDAAPATERPPLTVTDVAEIEGAVSGLKRTVAPETDNPPVPTLTCVEVKLVKEAGKTKVELPLKVEGPLTTKLPTVAVPDAFKEVVWTPPPRVDRPDTERVPLMLTADAETDAAVTAPERVVGPETDSPPLPTLACVVVRVLNVAGKLKLELPRKLDEPDTVTLPADMLARELVPATERLPEAEMLVVSMPPLSVDKPNTVKGPDTDRLVSPVSESEPLPEMVTGPVNTVSPATSRLPETATLVAAMGPSTVNNGAVAAKVAPEAFSPDM